MELVKLVTEIQQVIAYLATQIKIEIIRKINVYANKVMSLMLRD